MLLMVKDTHVVSGTQSLLVNLQQQTPSHLTAEYLFIFTPPLK